MNFENKESQMDIIQRLENKISDLTIALHFEKGKVQVYKELLGCNTNIKVDPGINIRPKQHLTSPPAAPVSTPVFVPIHPQASEPIPEFVLGEVETCGCMGTNKELENTYKLMNELIDKIKINKTYLKTLTDLQRTRSSLLGLIGLEEYKNICNEHVKTLTGIFTEKGFSDKKIDSQATKGLTSLEMRLIKHPNYFNFHLDVDDVRKITDALDSQHPRPNFYKVFDISSVCIGMFNYGSVLASLKVNLQRVLFNRNFNNIIYVDKAKSTKNDPFSFYVLTSVSFAKNNWNMDCRLEETTTAIRNDLLPFMINTFRELYRDIFGDNEYRSDYKTKCQLTECDCEQLLNNIFILASNNSFNSLLRNLVKEHSTYTPTDNDKFNIQSDDAMQKRRLKSFCDIDEAVSIRLFDTISSEEIKQFEAQYKSR